MKIHFMGVLAAYYSTILGREPLVHAHIEGSEKTLCKRILASHLSDYEEKEPTCPVCTVRYKKLLKLK